MLVVPITLPFENAKLESILETDTCVTITISTLPTSFILCRDCHCAIHKIHCTSDSRTLRDLPISGKKTFITYRPIRYICDDCPHKPTTTNTPNWHHPESAFTFAYERYILLELINSTIVDVSKREDLSEDAVLGILNRTVQSEVDWNQFTALGLIGIDEISLKKGYKDFVTVITSKCDGKITLLAVLKGRKKATIKAFLKTIPKRLKPTIIGFCSDMYDGYVNAIKAVFKNKTLVIIDRYHVAQLYRGAVDKYRQKILRQLKKDLPDKEYEKIKNSMHILRGGNECLKPEEKQKLDTLFSHSPELKEAYSLALKLTQIYNTHMSKEDALVKINGWIKEVENSRINCFAKFIGTLKKHKNEIANYFINRHTSGFVEGLNNKIKVLKRRCYGIHNIKNLFQRLHLDISGYRIFLENTACQASRQFRKSQLNYH